jgi:hypothetical protein
MIRTHSRRGIHKDQVSEIRRFTPFNYDALQKGAGLVQGSYHGYPLDFFPTIVHVPESTRGLRAGFASSSVPF